MPENSLGTVKGKEYRQRQRVTQLRQAVYGRADPREAADRMAELQAADEELRALKEERAKLERESPEKPAVLLDTASRVGGGITLGAETTGIDAKVFLRLSHVPTSIVHLLDADTQPLVSTTLANTTDDTVRVRVTSSVEGYSAQAVTSVEVPTDETAEIKHLPTFFPAALAPVQELTRATLQVVIDNLDAEVEHASSHPIWLLARTSAFNAVKDPSTSAWIDLTPYYGAWVTPNAPEVQAMLREAAALHPDGVIGGYQGDQADVAVQVKAVYQALKARHIAYVNSVISFGAGELESMQRVRLPREALTHRSANCIDGTVLMASVLEAASLNPGIALVPGHAFLARETWEAPSGTWDYLETTMIGSHDFEAAVDAGRRQAKYHKVTPLSVADLRVNRGITPME
jgi:hypothetical protein